MQYWHRYALHFIIVQNASKVGTSIRPTCASQDEHKIIDVFHITSTSNQKLRGRQEADDCIMRFVIICTLHQIL